MAFGGKLIATLATAVASIGIVGLALCLFVLFVFGKLSDDVLERETHQLDTTVLLWIHTFANPSLDRGMLMVTFFGDPIGIGIVFVASVGVFLRNRWYVEAALLPVASLGALALTVMLKVVFARQRPALWTHLVREPTYSYPSGHALSSLVLYGFLACVVGEHYPQYKVPASIVATMLVVAVAVSRLYLGVHWPSDIAGGFAVATLWLVICIVMVRLGVRRLAARPIVP